MTVEIGTGTHAGSKQQTITKSDKPLSQSHKIHSLILRELTGEGNDWLRFYLLSFVEKLQRIGELEWWQLEEFIHLRSRSDTQVKYANSIFGVDGRQHVERVLK